MDLHHTIDLCVRSVYNVRKGLIIIINSKQKNGLLSESLTMTELIKNNIPFAIPFGSFDEYDFIAKTSLGLKAIQVKTCYMDNSKNRFIVSLCTTHRRGGETLKNKKYSDDSFDFLVGVCHEPLTYYIIPISEISGRRSITLYPDGVPKSSENNARYTQMNNLEKYRNAWHLLS